MLVLVVALVVMMMMTNLLVASTKTLLCSGGYPKFKSADQEFSRNSNPRLIDEADAMLQRYVPISDIDLKFFFFPIYNTKNWAKTKKNNLKEF